MSETKESVESIAHSKWNCKYHIVFAPKYRRKVFFEDRRLEIREILRTLCAWKGVEIIEGEICPDHVHLLLSIPPKYSISSFMGYLKGKSATMIYQKWGNMKFAYRNREFWCKGYYVDTVTYFYGHCFQGGKNFAPLPALLRFMVSKGAFTIIFTPNSVNLREVRVQGF